MPRSTKPHPHESYTASLRCTWTTTLPPSYPRPKPKQSTSPEEFFHGIHDVFPPSTDDSKDPILAKKLQKGDGTFESKNCNLGFNFDGDRKTMWLEEEKRAGLLTILHQWLRGATKLKRGIPFAEFESVTTKFDTCSWCYGKGKDSLANATG